MKTPIKIIALLLIVTVGLMQCEKDKDVPYSSGSYWIEGTWKVSNFDLNGIDHTQFYDGYTFEFKRPNLVVAAGGGKKVNGKWSIANAKLSLDFGTEDPFGLLNNDGWDIIKQTATILELKGGSGSDGNQFLTLTRVK